jgi:acyl carrier protein
MMQKPSLDEFAQLLAGIFSTSAAMIGRTTQAHDVDGWDSVSHAMLIMQIEERYGIAFFDDEIYAIPDVGALYDKILERMNA